MKKKTILLVLVVAVIVLSIYYLESHGNRVVIPAPVGTTNPGPGGQPTADAVSSTNKAEPNPKDKLYKLAPELAGISGYLNTDNKPIHISDYRGKVVLVDFWTYTCINCLRTLPHVEDWYSKYKDMGFVVIGVHTPEFAFEKEHDNVAMAITKYGVEYPVVQDNDYSTWEAFSNQYWPHEYLIDADGYLRYDHIGEGNYDTTEKKIQDLLSEIQPAAKDVPLSTVADETPHALLTPEIYAGYDYAIPRGQDIGNSGGLKQGETAYVFPDSFKADKIYLDGTWQSTAEDLRPVVTPERAGQNKTLLLKYTAADVNMVAGSTAGTPGEFYVTLDDGVLPADYAGADIVFSDGQATLTVSEKRLYNVVHGIHDTHVLRLIAASGGSAISSFTFG